MSAVAALLRRVGAGTHRLATEYAARRQALASALPPGTLAVIPGHPDRFLAQHIPYRFRQQAELLYLTGWTHPNAVLVLDVPKTGPPTPTSVLFVDEPPADRELWDGRVPGIREAIAQFGVDQAEPRVQLEATLRRLAPGRTDIFVTDEEPGNAVVHGRLRAVLKVEIRGVEAANATWLQSCTASLDKLRVVKSSTEMDAIRRVCAASGTAYRKLIERCFRRGPSSGIREATVALVLLEEMVAHGIDEYFYPPVVAGGERGLTLHYVKNDAMIRPGEMVLIDAGGLQDNYGADISRTLPVSGTFSGPQAELYSAVLAVHEAVINLKLFRFEDNDGPPREQAMKTGEVATLSAMSTLSVDLMDKELRALGFTHTMHELTSKLYPHSVGHYLGLNVHDSTFVSRNTALDAGSVVTVEPGVYVPNSDRFPERFRGLAIRIEDDILFTTKSTIENLTRSAPKTIDEIHALSAS